MNDFGFINCEQHWKKLGMCDKHSGKDYRSLIGVYDVNKDGAAFQGA